MNQGRFAEAVARLQALEAAEGAVPSSTKLLREAQTGQAAGEAKTREVLRLIDEAQALLSRKATAAALKQIERALAVDPTSTDAERLRDTIQAAIAAEAREARKREEQLRRERERAEKERRDAVAAALGEARRSGSAGEAIVILRRALEDRSREPRVPRSARGTAERTDCFRGARD